jgi:hypothetical protein
MNVYAEGEIAEAKSMEGGGATLFSKNCDITIKVVTDKPLYWDSEFSGYLVVASFDVEGVIEYDGGSFVLHATRLVRTSEWGTDENGGLEAFVKRLRDRLRR